MDDFDNIIYSYQVFQKILNIRYEVFSINLVLMKI